MYVLSLQVVFWVYSLYIFNLFLHDILHTKMNTALFSIKSHKNHILLIIPINAHIFYFIIIKTK